MSQPFGEILEARLGKDRGKPLSNQLDGLCEAIAQILAQPILSDLPRADEQQLNRLIHERIVELREKFLDLRRTSPAQRIDPSLVEEARQETSDEEAVAIIKEFRESGGLTFAELIDGLEPTVAGE